MGSFSYTSGNGTPHFSAQARKRKKNPPRINFLYFRKRKHQKTSYIFSKESCSYVSGKRNPDKIPYISGSNFQNSKNEKGHS